VYRRTYSLSSIVKYLQVKTFISFAYHVACYSFVPYFFTVHPISCIYVFLIFVTPLLSKQIMVYHFPHDQYRFNHVCNSSDDTLYIPLSPIVLAVHVKYLMFVVGKEKNVNTIKKTYLVFCCNKCLLPSYTLCHNLFYFV
jgi:hypothetical protein